MLKGDKEHMLSMDDNKRDEKKADRSKASTRVSMPDNDETYLETMSGKELESAKSGQVNNCNVCGLSARTKEELTDHIRNAH